MCSINGLTGGDKAIAERMNTVTQHRGPDGSRVWSDGAITFGFNRLAIIDLDERAMQPMQDTSGRYTIIFNGEIYNYKELKRQLTDYPFKTESDTEVIVAACATWGVTALSRLNGMFALALWDSEEQRLILARDPVGVKPLYYHFDGTQLTFSSELPALFEAGVPRVLNRDALGHYMRLLYVPKEMTMIKGVTKLAPGTYLTFDAATKSLVTTPLMPWPQAATPPTYEAGVVAVREAVESAVKRQLVSDRPVGVYLSGGIDSSSILAAASKVHPHINTYSVGFDLGAGEEQDKFNADAKLAAMSAQHFGATHHEYYLAAGEVRGLMNDMVRYMSEPVANATTLAQLYLAKQTKETATVVLSGEGGDELFGGYERYRLALRAEQLAPYVPRMFARLLPGSMKSLHLRGVERFGQLMYQKDYSVLASLVGQPLSATNALFLNDFGAGEIVPQLMMNDERNWLVGEALLRADNMSMAASVESRVPLLDLQVRSLAHALPRGWKVTGSATKRVLKDAFRDVLPPAVLNAPKRGWFSPGAKWLRRPEFVEYTNTVFSSDYTPAAQLFDMQEVRRLSEEHKSGMYHYSVLWAVLVFLAWTREHKVTL